MLETVDLSVIEAPENIICHQVNCKSVMKSGLAKAIREKWPKAYREYIRYSNDMYVEGGHPLGTVNLVKVGENTWVANIFGQDEYGREPGKVYTNIEALKSGFRAVANFARANNLSVAIPDGIGCTLGGGDRSEIHTAITEIFEGCDARMYKYSK